MAEQAPGQAQDGAAEATGADGGPDPGEQEAIARHLGEELAHSFVAYVRGELAYAELTFHAFETLENLHAVAAGDYELEYEEDDAHDHDPAHYDPAHATEEQEDLAQEPARDGG